MLGGYAAYRRSYQRCVTVSAQDDGCCVTITVVSAIADIFVPAVVRVLRHLTFDLLRCDCDVGDLRAEVHSADCR